MADSPYLDLGYKPDPEKNILVDFRVEADDLKKAGIEIAAESSVGTWTEISTMQARVLSDLAATVYHIDSKKNLLRIAYPIELFEDHNLPQLLSDIAGNIFGMKSVDRLRFLDFSYPKSYANTFKGPAFGIEGVRKLLGTQKSRRPHIGTIVKPKVGLNPKETARVAFDAWAGGIDFVKDDENLTHQVFCPFEERIQLVLDARDRAMSETGEKKMYAPNITAETNKMLERADFVKSHGGNCIMVDFITTGFAGLQTVRDANTGMVIHAHRAMHAALTRDPTQGIDMIALAKMARLAGVDQLHTGAIFGKMEGEKNVILHMNQAMVNKNYTIKPV
ncbi:MAG: RuBisCO large subunit C-terminal-like domain-containing protein, partial [Candidatus Micrarchaeota archaeon]